MLTIREVTFSEEVLEKLLRKHNLAQYEVEEVIFSESSAIRLDEHRDHGVRFGVRGATSQGLLVQVWLQLVDAETGSFRCITAYQVVREVDEDAN